MNTTIQNAVGERSMAAVCRRRDQLQAEGIRPETLAWAVAEASEAAITLADVAGPVMVRRCLEQARSAETAGPESEALLVLSAAGVSRLRQELRSVGVSVPLTRNEAFKAIRVASAKSHDHDSVFRAIEQVGPRDVLTLLLDKQTPFTKSIAEAMVRASAQREGERVKGLTTIGAFGFRGLHRGLRVDAREAVSLIGLSVVSSLLEEKSPRRAIRARARREKGDVAQTLIALSFVQTSALKRAVAMLTTRARKVGFREVRRVHQAGALTHQRVYESINVIGAVEILRRLDGPVPFESGLAIEAGLALEQGDQNRAAALIDVCACGPWRLRKGLNVDVVEEIRRYGAAAIAEVVYGSNATATLRLLATAAPGAEAERLALLSFVARKHLERCTSRALDRRMVAGIGAALDGLPAATGRSTSLERVQGNPTTRVAEGGSK
jgi:hypothetical protein